MSAPNGLAARLLPVLAVHPEGLLTAQVAVLAGEESRKHVVEALRYNEKHGRVSARRRGPGVTNIWRVTEAGGELARQWRPVESARHGRLMEAFREYLRQDGGDEAAMLLAEFEHERAAANDPAPR